MIRAITVNELMNPSHCYICGSTQFRADRALAGKLICTKCGSPAGARRNRLYPKNYGSSNRLLNINVVLFIIIIIISIIIIM